MSDTSVSLLTPPGSGAIATIELAGPRAWEFARQLFRPVSKPLPEEPELHRFWFGRLGAGVGDEVVLAVISTVPQTTIEVHCHGGRRVVRWIIEQFVAMGAIEVQAAAKLLPPARLLPLASTLRTASILLDQLHGAFENTVRRILASLETAPGSPSPEPRLAELARYAPVGRHLITPWKVVVAGPPNVGKSSLVNALAGYQRTVVSEIAGTTRDVIRVQLAFEGWPVEVTDTAGLREAEGLEAEGIDRAKRVLSEADLVLWLRDASLGPNSEAPHSPGWLEVWNKADRVATPMPGLNVSAKTGAGIPELVRVIVHRLVPDPPPPGAAVPYTPELADRIEAALADPLQTCLLLRDCLQTG